MTTKLHQILAVEKDAKSRTESAVTRAYQDAQKAALFNGLTRVYSPKDDEDRDRLPTERKLVQFTTDDIMQRAVQAWIQQADVVATKDATNQTARADVIVDGNVLLTAVPVTTLLYLEKLLGNVAELIKKLPTLDPEVEWVVDPTSALYRSQPEETVRTKKIPKAFVKAPATDKFPAQVDTYTEDVIVGTWQRTLFSGAVPAKQRAELLTRVDQLRTSVKMAREYANQAVVVPQAVGKAIFDFLLTSTP
jgi:hypothetical protein